MKQLSNIQRTTATIAFVMTLCAWSLLSPAVANAQISGMVMDDATGHGIVGATVTFTNTAGVTSTATSGSSGDFTITTLANGTYTVKAVLLPDYPELSWAGMFDSLAHAYVTTVTVPPGNSYVYIYLHRSVNSTLTGNVTDAVSLLPISGARVTGTATTGGNNWSVTTNGSGAYSTTAITGGYNVTVSKWGYTSSTPLAVTLATGANTQSFTLTALPTVTISGTVQGSPGGLLAGATVNVHSGLSGDSSGMTLTATTDASGNYSIIVPLGSDNLVSASATGYISQTYPTTVVASANMTVNFTLIQNPPEPTRVKGRILDCAGGNLYAPGTVYAYPVVGGIVQNTPVTAPVDSGNNYGFTGLAVGSYYLWFLPNDHLTYSPDYYSSPSCTGDWTHATAVGVAASQQISGLDINVQSLGVAAGPYLVMGTITVLLPAIREVPLDSVRVYARDSMGMLLAYATTDKNGHFSIANLPRGMYHLSVDRIGYKVVVKDSVVDLTSKTKMTDTADFKVLEPGSTVGIATQTDLPTSLSLHENYPNPFVGSTTMSFATDHSGAVVLDVRDVLGRIVSTVINGTLPQGEHLVNFNGANLPAGVYFTRLASAGRAVVKTMVVRR